jgi:DNA-binding GntR family transcriptional regulator
MQTEPTPPRSADADVADDYAAIQPFQDDRTVESSIARQLSDLITSGELQPGLRLRYRDVADRFGVSVTPVRIALHALAKEGLVRLVPYGGAHVAPLSIEELEQVYASRAGLEGLIAHLGAEHMTDDALSLMRADLDQLTQLADGNSRETYLQTVWRFRLHCYELAERPPLLDSVKLLVRRSGRYSALALEERYRFEESLQFQRRFADACERRSGWDAELVTREATDWSRRYLATRLATANAGTSQPA